MHFPLAFNSAVWRGILKMACNLVAHHDRSLFLQEGFDPVREFVLKGSGDPWEFIAVNLRRFAKLMAERYVNLLSHEGYFSDGDY